MVYVGYFSLTDKLHCFRECKSQAEADIFINRNRDSNKLIVARVLSNKERGLYVKR